MPQSPRTTEVRLIVVAVIDLADAALTETLKAQHRQPSSIAEVVADEVVSSLESVSYVKKAIVGQL